MRFLHVEVAGVLGLHGIIDFTKNPVLFYGRNLSGKTNLINLIRFCFVFKKGGKYTEEKRLDKDELLPGQSKDGKAVFYFGHKGKFYRLDYTFKRSGSAVGQKVQFYETQSLPDGNQTREALAKANWTLAASNATQLKEKLLENEIYSDMIDVLISPSNVRNFSDAINKDLVTIPEIVAKQVSNVNKAAVKLTENFQKLESTAVREKETYSQKLEGLKHQFQGQSSLDDDEIARIFSLGAGFNNLSNRLATVERELAKLPAEQTELEVFKQKWASDFKDKMQTIEEAKVILREEKEAVRQFQSLDSLHDALDGMKSAQISLKSLPSKDNIASLSDFQPPSMKGIDFGLLLNSKRIQDLFGNLDSAKEQLKAAKTLAQKHKVNLRLSEISSLASSFKQLAKAIKSPKEKPKGDEAIIVFSSEEKTSRVFIPMEKLLENPSYLKGIESTPFVFKTGTLNKKRLALMLKEIDTKTTDLGKCRDKLKSAIDNNESVRKMLSTINEEVSYLVRKEQDSEKKLRSLLSEWERRFGFLTKAFAIESYKHSLDSIQAITKFVSSLEPILKAAEANFMIELRKAMTSLGVELPKELGKIETVNIEDLLKKQSQELSEKRVRLEKVKVWINTNLNEVKEAEDKLSTIGYVEDAVSVAEAILGMVIGHSNLDVMMEQIAQSIEDNVRRCAEVILPEENVRFRHVGKGDFVVETTEGDPITHPAGSHKAVISLGIMLTLSKLFDLPILLDEATDRFDYLTLRNTFQFVNMLCKSPTNPQVCFVSYKTLNIEKSQEVLDIIKDWNIYLLQKEGRLQKEIIEVTDLAEILSQSS